MIRFETQFSHIPSNNKCLNVRTLPLHRLALQAVKGMILQFSITRVYMMTSLRLDLKVLGLTVKNVFSRHGLSAEGEATMPRFTGSPKE